MDNAKGLIYSLFDIALTQDVLFVNKSSQSTFHNLLLYFMSFSTTVYAFVTTSMLKMVEAPLVLLTQCCIFGGMYKAENHFIFQLGACTQVCNYGTLVLFFSLLYH